MECIIKYMAKPLKIIIALVLLVSLYGCNNGGNTENTQSIRPNNTATSRPNAGGTLRIPMQNDLAAFDPLTVKYKMMQDLYGLVYEPFIEIGTDRKANPSIAENWIFDEAKKAWVFSIRRGIKWHNTDEEVNAYDVAYTLDRLFNEITVYTASVKREIKSYQVLDLYRLEVTPNYEGLTLFYALNFPVVSKTHTSADLTASDRPRGTGPYKVSEYKAKDGKNHLTLGINEIWWKKKPYIQKVECISVLDESEALSLYSEDALDAVPIPSNFTSWYKQFGEGDSIDYLVSDYEYLIPNLANQILSQVSVRKAIAYAIDTRSIITQVYGNHGVSSDTPVMPDSWLNRDDKMNYDFDPDMASSILADDGWRDKDNDGILEKNNKKLQFKMLVNSNENNKSRYNAALLISKDLKKVGMQVDIESLPWEEYSTKLNDKAFETVLVGSRIGLNPDLSNFLSSKGMDEGVFNSFQAENIFDNFRKVRDEEEFKNKYVIMHDRLLNEIPFIGLYFHTNSFVYKSTLYVENGLIEGDAYKTIDKWYFK